MVKNAGFADPYDNGWFWRILTELCLVGWRKRKVQAVLPGFMSDEKQRDCFGILEVFNPGDRAGAMPVGRAFAGGGKVGAVDSRGVVAGMPVIRRFATFRAGMSKGV